MRSSRRSARWSNFLFERLGIEPPKGVLLHGPPGTGKTLLAKAVANETNSNFILINGPEIMSKYYGQSEENLRKKFEEAEKNAPSIIFIDEIDAIASKREESKGEVERRVVAQLLTMMDGLKSRGKVVVIAATNIPNTLDPALRRPGRFDREIEVGVPQVAGRLNILKIHTRNMPLEEKGKEKVDLNRIAAVTHGFVGADLSALAKEAAMIVLRRVLPDINLQGDEELPQELLEKLIITQTDFTEALKVVRPSALREVLIEVPNVVFEDIGGLLDVKQELEEAVEWPLKHKEAFSRLGVKPPKGVLMYGPPGTGKTLLAKAVAHESEANFILVKGPELLSKWVGESEKAVRKIFEKARQTSPTIIFFDEIDSLAPRRGMNSDSNVTERVVNQLLTEMDGLQELNDIVIIAATNRPDIMDTALLRPGRFDRIIHVSVPDKKSRKMIFEVHLKGMPLAKDVDINRLVDRTEGYVGADIEAICREAAILALREDIKTKEVSEEFFEKALQKVRPSVTKDIEQSYRELEGTFRQARGRQLAAEKPSYYG
jgi:transitional endoplasmic reticulum ATPase